MDVLGGQPHHHRVHGPLGVGVVAEWRWFDHALVSGIPALDSGGAPANPIPGPARRLGEPAALIEMARCSGLALVGGAGRNDPVAASSMGTGELIEAALQAGAAQIVVACGGSASTDGGLGAIEVIGSSRRLGGTDLVVACDVETRFVEAAAAFAPQKGANPAQVRYLTARLERLARDYKRYHGVDVASMPGGGAAGGLAGGLAAMGARLVQGFCFVAEAQGLARRLVGADLVVTGEGHLDAQSFRGKVVGGVLGMARAAGVPALVVVGRSDPEASTAAVAAGGEVKVVSLAATFGRSRAMAKPFEGIETVVGRHLASLEP